MIDTHALVWMIEGRMPLGQEAREVIERARQDGGVLIPAVTVWELALAVKRGGLVLTLDVQSWIDLVLALPGFLMAPLEPSIAIRTVALDWDHRDPADRMIVATALDWEVPLITADEKILRYAAAGHVQALDARL